MHPISRVDLQGKEHSFVGNIAWGIRWGVLFSLGFIAYIALLFLARGQAPFAEYGMTFGRLVTLYLGAGMASGAVVGVLRPLGRWFWGAAVIGFFAGVVVASCLMFLENGVFAWGAEDVVKVTVLGLVWGPAGGLMLRTLFRRTDDRHR